MNGDEIIAFGSFDAHGKSQNLARRSRFRFHQARW